MRERDELIEELATLMRPADAERLVDAYAHALAERIRNDGPEAYDDLFTSENHVERISYMKDEYFGQHQQPNGSWEQATSITVDLSYAVALLDERRRSFPDSQYRLALRTTTVTVSPLPDCLSCLHWNCDGNGPCGALLNASQRCSCVETARPTDSKEER